MIRNPRTTSGGVVGAVGHFLSHRRIARRVMLAGVLASFAVLIVMLVTTSGATALTVFVALVLSSCLLSCVVVWRVSEHDAAVLEQEVEALRARSSGGRS